MRIYVMVDAEGLCGIHLRSQVMPDGERYGELRRLMTDEINHVVKALKDAGASRVLVRDAHAAGNNVLWSQLTDLADGYIMGNSHGQRMPGLADCDAVVLLGYHAMAGTPQAILEHTMSSKVWQNCWINGVLSGEVALDAAHAGELGKPVILVSGDDKVCAEAKQLMPDVVTAEVKKALSLEGAEHLPPGRAFALLGEKAREALEKLRAGQIRPFQIAHPVTLRLELVERGQIPNPLARPDLVRVDGRTCEVTADTIEQAIDRLP
ncbi:MAG: M55 family metallopeptidase [Eubacteriales bacterium]|nr:M55 family metallopeptidase [Eubacteriales bacterium]